MEKLISVVTVCIILNLGFMAFNNSNYNFDQDNTEFFIKHDFEADLVDTNEGQRDTKISTRSNGLIEQSVHGGSFLDSFEDNTGIDFSDNLNINPGNVKIIGPDPKPFEVDPYTEALWHFDEGTGPTAHDTTSNYNNGTLYNGVLWTPGKFGSALKFDGSNDYVEVPDSDDVEFLGSQSKTFEFWINATSKFEDQIIFHKDALVTPSYICGILTNGSLVFSVRDTVGNTQSVYTSTDVRDSKWHLITFVRDIDNQLLFIYVDGSEEQRRTYSSSNSAINSADLNMGNDEQNSREYAGILDEVRISNISRVPDQKQATLISKTIVIPENMNWNTIVIEHTQPKRSFLNVTILNAADDQVIPGGPVKYTGGEFVISYIDPVLYPSIKLKADFVGNSWGVTPILKYWGVSWNASNAWRDTFFKYANVYDDGSFDPFNGTTRLRYPDNYGVITSYSFRIPSNYYYDALHINRIIPAYTNISVYIIDAQTNMVIENYLNLNDTDIDIFGIDPVQHPHIRLRAYFQSQTFETPILFDWSVNWTNNYKPYRMECSPRVNEVNRTSTVEFVINVYDGRTPEYNLSIAIYYAPLDSDDWNDEFLLNKRYLNGEWLVDFTPSYAAILGMYNFRLICTDDYQRQFIEDFEEILTVKNNPPSRAQIELTPGKPKTTDDLHVKATSTDLEYDQITYQYLWYKNDVYQDDLLGTVVNWSYTNKGETWRCEVIPNDGNLNGDGPSNSTSVIIINTPPVVQEPIDDIEISEDEIDDTSIDLIAAFFDLDNDILSYSCSGQDRIDVRIDAFSGMVELTPDPNWFGGKTLIFTANDTESEVSDTVEVVVNPKNDPPVLKKAGDIDVSSPGKVLEFSVNEDEELNIVLIAEDIDGDKLLFTTNRTDDWGSDDINEIIINDNEINFRPRNHNVGSILINLTISDSKGGMVYYTLLIDIYNVNDPPIVEIIEPINNTIFKDYEVIDFACKYSDPDLLIPGTTEKLNFTWTTTEVTKSLGNGVYLHRIEKVKLTPGIHEITVTVTDNDGEISRDTITVVIKEIRSEGDDLEGSLGTVWIIAALVLVIVILLFVFLFLKKKKIILTKTEPQPTEDRPKAPVPPLVPQPALMPQYMPPQQFPAGPGAAPPMPPQMMPQDSAPQQLPAEKSQLPESTKPEKSGKIEISDEEAYALPKTKPVLKPTQEAAVPYGKQLGKSKPDEIDEDILENKELLEQLEKLGELRAAGILTDEEFQRKKAELLR
jgi:hypothetical protein